MEEVTEYIQDGIIKLYISDTEFIGICRQTVNLDLFNGNIRKKVCRAIYSYYDKFKKSPQDDFNDYFKSNNNSIKKEEKKLFKIYFNKLKDINVNKKYIIEKLNAWIQYQRLSSAVIKSAKLIKNEQYDEVKETILEAFHTKFSSIETGDNFWDYDYVDDENEVACPTDIQTIDNKIRGYCREELWLWLGATNIGKTWALVDGARSCLFHGKKAIYYSLEMSANRIKRRLGMAISGLRHTKNNKTDLIVEFFDGSSYDFSKRKKLQPFSKQLKKTLNLYKRKGGNVIIKEGIEGKWTVNTIESHLNQLELVSQFVPDVIFIDHADYLTTEKRFKDKIDEVDDVFINLRRVAKERNIAVVSATQGNRQSIDAKRVGIKEISRWIGKAQIADVVMSLNQTEDEIATNTMRLFAAKVREGAKYWTVRLHQLYDIGAFCLEDEEEIYDN